MVGKSAKNVLLGMKLGIRGFFGSLITDPSSTFRNSIWRTKMQKKYFIVTKFDTQGFSGSLIVPSHTERVKI